MIPCSLIFLTVISVNIALQTEECLMEGILSIIIWIGVRFIIEEEKLCMTELFGRRWHEQTWHVQTERPRGIQPIIMWSPRNLKWKILATHD